MDVKVKKGVSVEHPEHGMVTITGVARVDRKQVVKYKDSQGTDHSQGAWAFRKAVASTLSSKSTPKESIEVARAIETTKQSSARDESTTAKKVYAPTPEAVKAWAQGKPGDLSGVDTKDQKPDDITVHKERDRSFMGFVKALLS